MRSRALEAVASILLLSGCNAIFGITAGLPGGGACPVPHPTSCEPDRMSDASSCCITGRSCQGGTCESGECGPVHLSGSDAGEEAVEVLVVGDEAIWSTGSGRRILAASLSGSSGDGVKRTVGTTQGTTFQSIYGLATDGTNLYFTDYPSADIGRMPIAGGDATLIVHGDPNDMNTVGGVPKLAVAGGYLYWAVPVTGIYRASLEGPFPAQGGQLVAQSSNCFAVAADETHVYWWDAGANAIHRLAHDKVETGGAPEVVVSEQFDVYSMTVDADSVIWTDHFAVYVAEKTGKDQGVVSLMAEQDSSTNEVYSDGHDVYWTTTAFNTGEKGGRVRRISKKGGPAHLLSQNDSEFGMGGVAGSCDTLVWLDGKSVSVQKATK